MLAFDADTGRFVGAQFHVFLSTRRRTASAGPRPPQTRRRANVSAHVVGAPVLVLSEGRQGLVGALARRTWAG